LIEIGEAVKRISPSTLAEEPGIPWEDIAGMRDRLAHRYFDTSHVTRHRPGQTRPRPSRIGARRTTASFETLT